jgi:hypothetical protein
MFPAKALSLRVAKVKAFPVSLFLFARPLFADSATALDFALP